MVGLKVSHVPSNKHLMKHGIANVLHQTFQAAHTTNGWSGMKAKEKNKSTYNTSQKRRSTTLTQKLGRLPNEWKSGQRAVSNHSEYDDPSPPLASSFAEVSYRSTSCRSPKPYLPYPRLTSEEIRPVRQEIVQDIEILGGWFGRVVKNSIITLSPNTPKNCCTD